MSFPRVREMAAACAIALVVIVGGVGVNMVRGVASNAGALSLGGDFVQWYAAGRILNEHQADRLYDADLQDQVYRQFVPGASASLLPFVNPPLVALPFRALARLPFSWALFVFMMTTPLLFVGGLALLNARFGPDATDEQALLFLGGISFFPFIGYTWLGAQISVVGFAAIAFALYEDDRRHFFLSGLALSLCVYKPTLLLLIVPMLLVSGRYRQALGVISGTCVLVVASFLLVGRVATLAFVSRVTAFAAGSTSSGRQLNPNRYVDLNAFFRLLPGGQTALGHTALVAVVIAVVTALGMAWLRSRTSDRPERLFVWGATLTWTLVVNIYTPMYDTILVVAAGVLSVAAVRAQNWHGWRRLAPALIGVYVTPWLAELSARTFKLQVYTVVLCGFGTLLLYEARASSRRHARAEELGQPSMDRARRQPLAQ